MMESESLASPPDTLKWLKQNVPEFDVLDDHGIKAATDFILLWSFFELTALQKNANVKEIEKFAKKACKEGRMDPKPLDCASAYFRDRYFQNKALTPGFDALYQQNDKGKSRVEDFLKGEGASISDQLTALLLIVYRLRNNFVHGTKIAYGLREQTDNFLHANSVLMGALGSLNY